MSIHWTPAGDERAAVAAADADYEGILDSTTALPRPAREDDLARIAEAAREVV
jgi:hypothetical protein